MITTVLLASLALAEGEAFKFTTKVTGCIQDLNYYRVLETPMSKEKPAWIVKEPVYRTAPLYATLNLGEGKRKTVTFALDETDDDAKFYLDGNANGDLTDDPPTFLWRKQVAPPERREILKVWTSYWFDGLVTGDYGRKSEPLGLKFYIYSKADIERNKMQPVLLYYRDYYRQGSVTLGGKAFRAAIVDDDTDGRYDSAPKPEIRFPGDTLLIDLDASGKFERSVESFPINQPFNVDGTTYEVAKVQPSGATVSFRKSDKYVPPKIAPKSLKVGEVPPDFAFTGLDGTSKTLSSMKGSLVLVDFWATWCGPCIASMPKVRDAYRKFHSQGLEIVGVSLDQPEDGKKWADYVRDHEMPWLQVHDASRDISKRYYASAIPMAVLVGRDGKILATNVDADDLDKAISAALGR